MPNEITITDQNVKPKLSTVAAKVDTPTLAFKQMYKECKPCQDLMGGTEAMRRAGEDYLPKRTAESDEVYRNRVRLAVLENIFAQTVSYDRGQVFRRNVVFDNADNALPDESMKRFNDWSENCDRQGNNLTSWAGDVFENGLINGVTFALVDYPFIEEREGEGGVREYRNASGEWAIRNAEADIREGWNPYLVHIDVRQVLDCRSTMQNGKQVITHFRYKEVTTEPNPLNPWSEKLVEKIHAYWLDHWEVWIKTEDDKEFWLYQQGRMTLNEIPVCVFMAGKKRTEFTARPALMDLAWLNIRHWQVTSGHSNLMEYNQNPVWAVVGIQESYDERGKPKKLLFSPGHVLWLPQGGGVTSCGVDAGCVAASRQELLDLKESMASYGMQLLKAANLVSATATQIDRESRENNSTLQNWALDFQDFLENCMRYVGLWWGLQDGPSVKINDVYADNISTDYLLRLKDKGLISNETCTMLLKRAGGLPDDFDYEKEQDRLAQDLSVNGSNDFNKKLSEAMQNG